MEKLITVLKEIRPEFDFQESRDFIADGMLDSLDIINLVSALDEDYRISIGGTEIVPENFRSLESIAALLRLHQVNP